MRRMYCISQKVLFEIKPSVALAMKTFSQMCILSLARVLVCYYNCVTIEVTLPPFFSLVLLPSSLPYPRELVYCVLYHRPTPCICQPK